MIWLAVAALVLQAQGDAFWCPMHLDVRSSSPGKCAVCSMELVPIPPARLGQYRLDVTPIGRSRVSGLRLAVTDPDGTRVPGFETIHERPFHLFIIGRDLRYFAHVHPEPAGTAGDFTLRHPLPAGEYMLIADFYPRGGTAQMLHRALVTPGHRGPLFQQPPPLTPGPTDVIVDGVRVRVDAAALTARKESPVTVAFTGATTGAPVTDLEPYLGAPAHMLVVSPDLGAAIHAHPDAQAVPDSVTFQPLVPAPGTYKLWIQFQRRGKVSTAAFVVTAR